ncbi:MAG: aminoacetone oxidase family FAD-binding enzyme [Pyrinomonadaceae bacterium]|nr:aminoacetone oxidase family FAD-binding enzyme [Phycisphaerales bacterium]
MTEQADIAVVGGGAAGLMAAIWAGRTNPTRRIVVLDGARRLGAKILVAGGGRCNVTHHAVDERAYAGSSRNAIKKVLRRFDVGETTRFFDGLGVELKQEETGKLFPVSDDAKTILDALMRAADRAGVELLYPRRVETIERLLDQNQQAGHTDAPSLSPEAARPGQAPGPVPGAGDSFLLRGTWGGSESINGALIARRVVLATGGMSLPKTGSDGQGFSLARSLGHRITPRVFPALVPLTLPRTHFICGLSGLTLETTLELRSRAARKLQVFTNSMLCTHFGLSGPGVLDISRYYLDAVAHDPGSTLVLNWLPGTTVEALDAAIVEARAISVGRVLREKMPERLSLALCQEAGVDPAGACSQLPREQRRTLVRSVVELVLPVAGDRGFAHAEVTAGGVPLDEIRLETMESRVAPGLHLCGEICDVDGRIGGFNFQWAWASGYTAGVSV